jgi:hypothetical protein
VECGDIIGKLYQTNKQDKNKKQKRVKKMKNIIIIFVPPKPSNTITPTT